MSEIKGRILTPSGLVRGVVRFDERIEAIIPADVDGPLVLPGFIDAHVHGGGGGDTMDGAEGVRRLARFHLEHGTTTLLPTTITNPWERIMSALAGVAEVRDDAAARSHAADDAAQAAESRRKADPDELLPDIPGAHLEGPFISPQRLGAQPAHALTPEPSLVAEVLERDVVRVVTLAPELPGALEAARSFSREGVRVSIGHSAADYATASEMLRLLADAGATVGFTHLFNAMGGVAGRAPGVAGAALASPAAYAEMILDGHHVSEGALRLALAAKRGRLLFVSDSIRAAGMSEGETELGGQKVTVAGGAARLADGTLAGSILTLDWALRNALSLGLSLSDASALVSTVPARYLGLFDRGEIALGKRADLVLLDHHYRVSDVYVMGFLMK